MLETMKAHPAILALLAMALPVRSRSETLEVLARAQPDQFVVTGSPAYYRYGAQPPESDGYVRVNHDYLWSMAATPGSIWLGDVANAVCGDAAVRPDNPIRAAAANNLARACDFEKSTYPGVPRWIPDVIRRPVGDWRPPDVLRYDLATGQIIRRTPRDGRLMVTEGFRAAGANRDVVLFAGPHLYRGAINLFAYAARSGTYLGSTTMEGFANIRRFTRVGADLYAGVENLRFPFGGSVLRWRPTIDDPFRCEDVGTTDAGGAFIALHEGRLFVSTWPGVRGLGLDATGVRAGLWMSPPVPSGGLHADAMGQWRKVWNVSNYEPDPLVAQTYSGGALCSFGGYLFWGTMQFPGEGYEAMRRTYGDFAQPGPTLTNTLRAACLFRGRHFGGAPWRAPEVELLYGEPRLPVYDVSSNTWTLQATRAGPARHGPAGFGQRGNCFTWSMERHDGRLYIGTQDYRSYLHANDVVAGRPVPPDLGGDLYCLPTTESAVVAVTRNGAGNCLNHGFRTLLSNGRHLYAGTANVSNLRDLPGAGHRGGGWEFLRLIAP